MVKLKKRLGALVDAATQRDVNLEANPRDVGPIEVDFGYMFTHWGLGVDVSYDHWAKAWSSTSKRLAVVITVGPLFVTVAV